MWEPKITLIKIIIRLARYFCNFQRYDRFCVNGNRFLINNCRTIDAELHVYTWTQATHEWRTHEWIEEMHRVSAVGRARGWGGDDVEYEAVYDMGIKKWKSVGQEEDRVIPYSIKGVKKKENQVRKSWAWGFVCVWECVSKFVSGRECNFGAVE